MSRRPGASVRLKLTLSYAGFIMVAGALLLTVVWAFLLRYVPARAVVTAEAGFSPGRDDLLRAFIPAAGWALLFLLAFGLVGGWILAGRMLAPLTRITSATRRAASGSLSHRIELEGRQDEFRELADSFDMMLAALEAQVAEQQRFAANASHELRTPLAIAQMMLEVAREDPDRDAGELIERLHEVNVRAIELTEALLLMSRADRRAFDAEPVDLSLVAEQAAETLLPLAEQRRIEITVTGGIAMTRGSPALLQQMAVNLVHNAIVHNAIVHNLPERGTVTVHTSAGSRSAVLTVENTGEVVAPHLASTLTEPFQRGTERIRGDYPGLGLGLAIVKSIVRAHDGILAVEARAGGGLRVTVRLPAALAGDRPDPHSPRSAGTVVP